MHRRTYKPPRSGRQRHLRRGATIVYVTIFVSAMFGFLALSVDMGRLYVAKAELQRAADAAAHAAAWQLLNEDRLKPYALEDILDAARRQAADMAAANDVLNAAPIVDSLQDVVIGRLNDLSDLEEPMSFGDEERWNAVRVTVQRSTERGGSILLYFAPILGFSEKDLGAQATAAFEDGIDGFEVTDQTGNAPLLPYALKNESWQDLMGSPFDNYTYDPDTGEVSDGPDGLPEINVFPGGTDDWQVAPGNFGTVDIGGDDNSASDLGRQISEGISAEDLAYHGGKLELGEDGYVDLNGDTGISAGVKDELEEIMGQPRVIPLFSDVWDPGNNATFRIVGWGGIRIMHVRLTGAEDKRQVIVQPALIVHDTAIGGDSGSSYYVYRPVQLVR
ncbi:MAG TPA: pilus assembly protein TadG-related protein [Phycisphaerae bacterium]|nr:pilus assembly protein TadG-related protein [Phycisphaerae bacterium]